jgi:DNA-binding NarL/FixJ family response regulator
MGTVSQLKKITILLVDDHAVVRRSLRKLLEIDSRFKVIGQAQNGRQAVKMAHALAPDVILMDIAMPVLNGLQATRQILAVNPRAKVLILSAHSDDAYIECMTTVGAVGFLEKQTSPEMLTKAIYEVTKGNSFFSPPIAKRMANGKNWSRDRNGALTPKGVRLTSRETEVLKFVAKGQANKQVAATLGIGIKAVEKHRQHAADKLNIHEKADLALYAITHSGTESSVQLTIV